MKTMLLGVAVVLLGIFTTSAVAATKLASTGCCPLCK